MTVALLHVRGTGWLRTPNLEKPMIPSVGNEARRKGTSDGSSRGRKTWWES